VHTRYCPRGDRERILQDIIAAAYRDGRVALLPTDGGSVRLKNVPSITAAVIALCAFCTALGCAIYGYTWEKSRQIGEVRIRVFEVSDARTVCKKYLPDQNVIACAVMKADYCEIYVPPNSPALIAHESVHCLGYAHRSEDPGLCDTSW